MSPTRARVYRQPPLQSLTEGNVIPAWHFGFVVFCALTRFQVGFQNFRFVSPSPPLISSFCYITNYQTTVPTVKRSFTNQKTFCNRIVNRCNSLDSFLQIINLIMVFVNSQNVKLKRMKYHDPILWGNVLKGLYSLQTFKKLFYKLFTYMKSLVFYIQYQFTLLNCTKSCPRKKQNPKRKKARKEFVST